MLPNYRPNWIALNTILGPLPGSRSGAVRNVRGVSRTRGKSDRKNRNYATTGLERRL